MTPDNPLLCDHCGEPITDPEHSTAILTWLERTTDGVLTGFAITHEKCGWAWRDGNEEELPLRSHHELLLSLCDEDGIARLAGLLASSRLDDPSQAVSIIERIERLTSPRST